MLLSKLKPYHPTKFGAYRSCESGDILFFFCHVVLRNRIIQVHVSWQVEAPRPKSPLQLV